MELERRVESLYAERDGLSSTLDESADRIIMLEKEQREQDNIVSNYVCVCDFLGFFLECLCVSRIILDVVMCMYMFK